jgi:hypothetical protein
MGNTPFATTFRSLHFSLFCKITEFSCGLRLAVHPVHVCVCVCARACARDHIKRSYNWSVWTKMKCLANFSVVFPTQLSLKNVWCVLRWNVWKIFPLYMAFITVTLNQWHVSSVFNSYNHNIFLDQFWRSSLWVECDESSLLHAHAGFGLWANTRCPQYLYEVANCSQVKPKTNEVAVVGLCKDNAISLMCFDFDSKNEFG